MDGLESVYDLGYLVAASLFIFGLKFLGSPRTAPRGNRLGAIGMLIARPALSHDRNPGARDAPEAPSSPESALARLAIALCQLAASILASAFL